MVFYLILSNRATYKYLQSTNAIFYYRIFCTFTTIYPKDNVIICISLFIIPIINFRWMHITYKLSSIFPKFIIVKMFGKIGKSYYQVIL